MGRSNGVIVSHFADFLFPSSWYQFLLFILYGWRQFWGILRSRGLRYFKHGRGGARHEEGCLIVVLVRGGQRMGMSMFIPPRCE